MQKASLVSFSYRSPIRGRVGAYQGHPSLQRVVILEFSTIISFEDEFVVEFGERDSRIGVELFGVLGEGL